MCKENVEQNVCPTKFRSVALLNGTFGRRMGQLIHVTAHLPLWLITYHFMNHMRERRYRSTH